MTSVPEVPPPLVPARRSPIDYIHIAGSIASITGLSLLTLNRTLPRISTAEVVAALLATSIGLGGAGILLQLLVALFQFIQRHTNRLFAILVFLLLVPFILLTTWSFAVQIFPIWMRDVPKVLTGEL
ncbi:MAG: hypothetical protein WB973_11275 [Thermoanaerobaculia bacterium]